MNLGDYDGRTALHLAAVEGHFRCVKFLIDVCKVQHDVKDRWGQTPLSEAILFKHTKIAAVLKRHDRAKAKALQAGRDQGNLGGGEILWRKLVERKLMTPEEEKKKPVFKFNPALVKKDSSGSSEKMGELLKDLAGRTKTESTGDLEILKESDETDEGRHELNQAAKFIQSKFREYQRRKSNADTLTNGTPLSPPLNGLSNGSDSGVSA